MSDVLKSTEIESSPRKISPKIVACLSFFLLLCTQFSIPFGGSGDMDYHMASIWCARGEVDGVCTNIERNNGFTAEVPFMFQMCDGRNIDWWPRCEIETNNPATQRLRMASPEKLSLYYKIANVFVDEEVHLSVLRIRLFNSLITVFVLFGVLSLTTMRIRFAAIAGFSFSLIPNGPQIFSGVTTRGWAILGVMTSWAFLASYLNTPRTYQRLRKLQLSAFLFSFSLVLTTRIDALIMVSITSLVVIIAHYALAAPIRKGRLLFSISALAFLVAISQFIPVLRDLANFRVPNDFGVTQYWFFQIIHIPEYVADWWGYQVGQGGSGPGVVGLIGVVLFFLNFAFALQKSDFVQRLIVSLFTLIVFVLLAKSSSVVGSLVPLSGFYTLGLAVPWLGIAIANSNNPMQFMSSPGNRRMAILVQSFSYGVYFYSLIEFYTKRGKNIGYFDTISLNGEWWWNIWLSPNLVFIAGILLFPVFLLSMWRTVPFSLPNE